MSRGKNMTPEKVQEIKEFVANCPGAQPAFIASKCGVSVSTIHRVNSGYYDSLCVQDGLFDVDKFDVIIAMLEDIKEAINGN